MRSLPAVAAAAFVLAGCSVSTPAPTAAATTSPSASPTATVSHTAAPHTPSTNPAFVSLKAPHTLSCQGESTLYPHITWAVANATGVSVAIGSPGQLYDSYGPSGATDEQSDEVPLQCSEGQTVTVTYYFTTIGGTGPAVTRKVTITATP